MRRALLPLLSAALLVLPALRISPARAAQDDAKAIIAKAIKAHGGEKTLEKYKASKSKNKGKATLPTIGEVEFTQEITSMLPDKIKDVQDIEIAGTNVKQVTIINGDKFSVTANGMEVPINDAAKALLKQVRYLLKIGRLTALLKDKSYKLSTLGETKVEGKPCVGVRVSSKGQKDVSLYFDKQTGLTSKVEFRTIDPVTEKEVTQEQITLEYHKKKQHGMAMPKKILIKRDGKKYVEAESETTLLEKVDADVFKE